MGSRETQGYNHKYLKMADQARKTVMKAYGKEAYTKTLGKYFILKLGLFLLNYS